MKTFILLVCLTILGGCVVSLTLKKKIERSEITIYIIKDEPTDRHNKFIFSFDKMDIDEERGRI